MTNKPLSEMTPKEKVEAGIQKAQKSKPMTIEELSKSDKDLIEKCLLTPEELVEDKYWHDKYHTVSDIVTVQRDVLAKAKQYYEQKECWYLCRDYCICGWHYDPKTCPLKSQKRLDRPGIQSRSVGRRIASRKGEPALDFSSDTPDGNEIRGSLLAIVYLIDQELPNNRHRDLLRTVQSTLSDMVQSLKEGNDG